MFLLKKKRNLKPYAVSFPFKPWPRKSKILTIFCYFDARLLRQIYSNHINTNRKKRILLITLGESDKRLVGFTFDSIVIKSLQTFFCSCCSLSFSRITFHMIQSIIIIFKRLHQIAIDNLLKGNIMYRYSGIVTIGVVKISVLKYLKF